MNAAARRILRAPTFRWGVNTVASFVVNLGVTVGVHEGAGVRPEVAYATALATVFVMNFVFFRYYVFVQAEPQPIGRQFAVYAGSAVAFRTTEYLCFLVLHTLLGVHYAVTVVLVQGVSFVAKFFVYGQLVFRAARDRGERGSVGD